VQILGWFRAEAARASRLKRSSGQGVLREFRRQEFQRNFSAEFKVFRLKHDTHSSAAKLAENAVV
jgi:hypothetical protein